MKTEKNILIAFVLNLGFSVFELIGAIFTNSVAILSDSVHDMGDTLSIGISYFLERKSKKRADNNYTYGYIRYSVLGGFITTIILTISSILVMYNAICRIFSPVKINYNGMIILAVFGVIINFLAAYFTREGDSINQRSVNLHMLEDVLGWVVVLIGAIIMRFTDIKVLDSLMSIGVALFIFINTIKNLKKVLDLFLEKTPDNIDITKLKKSLLKINGVIDIHHIHVWSIDGFNNYATMHIVTKSKNIDKVKQDIRVELEENNIIHSILETETEICKEKECTPHYHEEFSHHHH